MPGQKAPEDQRREDILRAAYRVAARDRLTGLTVRNVAAEAGVSNGLVFFYFGSREHLLSELLDWLLEATLVAVDTAQVKHLRSPAERMLAVVRRDVEALPRQRARVALFFDYWVMGTRSPEIQRKIRAALDRYRDGFRPLAQGMIEAEPERYARAGAEGLAAVVAGFIEGCAIQVVMDPDNFDVSRYMETVRTLVAQQRLPAIR